MATLFGSSKYYSPYVGPYPSNHLFPSGLHLWFALLPYVHSRVLIPPHSLESATATQVHSNGGTEGNAFPGDVFDNS